MQPIYDDVAITINEELDRSPEAAEPLAKLTERIAGRFLADDPQGFDPVRFRRLALDNGGGELSPENRGPGSSCRLCGAPLGAEWDELPVPYHVDCYDKV